MTKNKSPRVYGDISPVLLSELNTHHTYNSYDKIDWEMLSITQPGVSFLIYFADFMDWEKLSLVDRRIKKPEFVEFFKDYVSWEIVSIRCRLTKTFLKKYIQLFDCRKLLTRKDLSFAMRRLCLDQLYNKQILKNLNVDQQHKETVSTEFKMKIGYGYDYFDFEFDDFDFPF